MTMHFMEVSALRASRFIKTSDHALTGVAIAFRPFGPKLRELALCDNPTSPASNFFRASGSLRTLAARDYTKLLGVMVT